MFTHMNTLPNELLLAIIDRIPLCDLLHLDQVSPRWASLLPSVLARRRTLVLILGGTRAEEMSFHLSYNDTFEMSLKKGELYYELPVSERDVSLTLPSLKSDASRGGRAKTYFTEKARLHSARIAGQLGSYFFAYLLPNVDKVVLIDEKCNEQHLRSVVHFVGSLPCSLRALKLFLRTSSIDREYRPVHHSMRTLLDAINRQPSLQQLTLSIDGDLNWNILPVESYSFIAKLKVLRLSLGNRDRNRIWEIVQRFDNPKLSHIDLGNSAFGFLSVDDVLNLEFEFTTKVRQLYYWKWNFQTAGQFGTFCLRFPCLTMLSMIWSPNIITFTHLVTNLALLTQLTQLKLKIVFEDQLVNVFALVNDDGLGGGGDGEEAPRSISLPQVKFLELTIPKRSHNVFESLSPLVFPSVEVIILKDWTRDCYTCRHELVNGAMHLLARLNRCHRLLILSLKNKFASSLVQLYARRANNSAFVDWTNYVPTEDDDLSDIGDLDDDQREM